MTRRLFNAHCTQCDTLAAGTLTDLLDAGWSGDLRWCLEHRHYATPVYVPPPEVRVLVEPFPEWVADRDHWEPDVWRPVGEAEQLRSAA